MHIANLFKLLLLSFLLLLTTTIHHAYAKDPKSSALPKDQASIDSCDSAGADDADPYSTGDDCPPEKPNETPAASSSPATSSSPPPIPSSHALSQLKVTVYEDQYCSLAPYGPIQNGTLQCYRSHKGQAFTVGQTAYTTCEVEVYKSDDCTGNVLYYIVGQKLQTCINHIKGPIDGSDVKDDFRFSSVRLNCPRWLFGSQKSKS